jgi:hypothetical protein
MYVPWAQYYSNKKVMKDTVTAAIMITRESKAISIHKGLKLSFERTHQFH